MCCHERQAGPGQRKVVAGGKEQSVSSQTALLQDNDLTLPLPPTLIGRPVTLLPQ